MNNGTRKKKEQLGINPGTASAMLKKRIMFNMARKLGEDICYQCNNRIETIEEFSLEHKIPWLDSENPTGLFFDLNNIAFSHLSCNSRAAERKKGEINHPSYSSYRNGCRCEGCRALERGRRRSQRARGIKT